MRNRFSQNPGMLYRRFGKTDIEVSAVGFGAAHLSGSTDPEAVVRAALEAGINFFDTAPPYGRSEEILGKEILEWRTIRSERPIHLSSKTRSPTATGVRADCEGSLKRMGIERIDFYHMWDVISMEMFRRRVAGGALREMERLRDEGLIGHICVSSHMPGDQIGILLNEYPFEGILLGYSAINFTYRAEGLAAAAGQGIGVGIMNPLGGGLIPQHPERFAFLCSGGGETVVEASLRFLFNDPRITLSLVGFSDVAQVAEAVQAVDGFRPLSAAALERIRTGLSKAFDQLCTGCGYCSVCPQKLPLPQLMDAYNQLPLEGTTTAVGRRLHEVWHLLRDCHRMDQCTRCADCEAACTQHLPILERLAVVEAARIERLALVDGTPPPVAPLPVWRMAPTRFSETKAADRAIVRPSGINPNLLRLADVLPLDTPFRINLNPSHDCNFHCRFCVMSQECLLSKTPLRPGSMPWELYVKLMGDLLEFPRRLKRLNLSGLYGEPLLNHRLADMVAFAKEREIAEIIEFYTNGSLITRERARTLVAAGLDIITISVEHVTDEDYRDVTGSWGDYKSILRSVAMLREERDRAGSSLRIDAKIIATYLSEEHVAKFGVDFADLADNVVKTELHNWSGNEGVNLMLKEPTIGFDSITPLNPDRAVCPFPFYLLQIDAAGRVTVCTADWQMGACVGDGTMSSLQSIWEGKPLRDLRVLMLKHGHATT
jgi:predicted aldo/keto reductase-like oxidoreductase/pyruvate-formate lyase-activating enzyme